MPANTTQIVDLINKLWARTQAGTLSWEQFGGAHSFQCRLGDFVVSINATGRGIGSIASGTLDVQLHVKRLDGKPVLSASTGYHGQNALSALSNAASVPYEAQKTLGELYRHLSTRDTDLDELLKQL